MKHDCNKGVGFRCGATRYICRYGELQVLEEIPENCNQAPSTIWTEKDTLDHTLLSHPSVISMEIEILNTDSARITFLEPIPVGWLSEDPYLTIDHSLRLSHYGGLSLNNTIYYHFRFETGDYLIDTVSTAYGTTIVYIDPS